jgi:hypothetical protein
MSNKKLSKSAQLLKDRDINKQLRTALEAKQLQDDREHADNKEKADNKISNELLEALKNAGVDTKSTVFADMERALNSNEAIRELVDSKNINLKTVVSSDQHKAIVILKSAYESLLKNYGIDFKGLHDLLIEFIELSPSIEGLRAKQYVEAHQAIAQALVNAQQNNSIRGNPSDMKQ